MMQCEPQFPESTQNQNDSNNKKREAPKPLIWKRNFTISMGNGTTLKRREHRHSTRQYLNDMYE